MLGVVERADHLAREKKKGKRVINLICMVINGRGVAPRVLLNLRRKRLGTEVNYFSINVETLHNYPVHFSNSTLTSFYNTELQLLYLNIINNYDNYSNGFLAS